MAFLLGDISADRLLKMPLDAFNSTRQHRHATRIQRLPAVPNIVVTGHDIEESIFDIEQALMYMFGGDIGPKRCLCVYMII
jgi:hypothetical protein